MASLPSPVQVAGDHYKIYEAYYQQVDPNNQGVIGAFEAARFLKKSKLSDIVLGKIWDLSNPSQKGSLNKQGFFVALKLCALAQSGRGISMDNITAADVPCPKMGDIPKIPPNKVINTAQPKIDWSVKPAEKAKYDQLFDSLQPMNGVIPGKKVRNVLMDSKLPVEILGKIWDLADLDEDGSLSRHEFMIAMHLVYKALEKHTIPNTLPAELMPPGRRKDSLVSQSNLIMTPTKPPVPPQPSIPPLPNIPPQPSRPPLPPQPSLVHQLPSQSLIITQQPSGITQSAAPIICSSWVVTAEDKARADALFQQTDFDKDGFVSGFEIKDVFLQSGVPQPVLAHIWSLCDTHQSGKLNNEQFALAMWLINQTVKGIDPPASLTPEMVPPCMRGQAGQQAEVMEKESNEYNQHDQHCMVIEPNFEIFVNI
ncbi:hypothetical protein RUM43_004680 [Polyplax serrata]|uniref:Epidermal growth factor receptor substrate 15-like 1 n=1 Tax=Polyplax serrata TaxID=468196 RepID=A0AAN8SCN3_POLSC